MPLLVICLYVVFVTFLCAAAWGDGFASPENLYRPKFRYWLPDASVSTEVVSRDIGSLASVGAGCVEFLPFYLYGLPGNATGRPTDWSRYGFGTTAYKALFRDALQAAEEAGILMDFAVGANQGQGVPSEPMAPGLAIELLLGNTSLLSGQTFVDYVPKPQKPADAVLSGGGFMHALEQFGTANLTAVIALQIVSISTMNITIPGYGQIALPNVQFNEASFVDLTAFVEDGQLNWTAPQGNATWRIFSFWQRFTNQRSSAGGLGTQSIIGNGSWTVDHFSGAGAKLITDFVDEYILSDNETVRLLNSVGNYAWEDSMEIMATLYWTPGLLDRFRNMHGYDLTKYLPLLFSSTNSWARSFPSYFESYSYGEYTTDGDSVHNLDYRAALNAGYQQYISHFTRWAHSKGLKYSAQPAYNLPLQMLSDISFVDAPEGESLGFENLVDAYRQFAGPAHLEGRAIISTEVGAVSAPPYSQTIPDLLFRIKRSLAGGFNMNVIHGSPYSGNYPNTTWPGYTTFFYAFTEMWNSLQPCWQHMKDTLDYVARNQYILQRGVAKVDLAFYLYAAPWTPTTQYPSTNLQDLGYSYDYIGPDNLLSPFATVERGRLSPNGPSYKAIVFSGQTIITVKAVEAVVSFAAAGLPIIMVGLPPNETYPATEANQMKLSAMIRHLLSEPNVQTAPSIDALPSILAKSHISPRVLMNCTSNPVYPVWRSDAEENVEYVFFYNDQPTQVYCDTLLGVSNSFTPYIYDAWTGQERLLAWYTQTSNGIKMPLRLEANETAIIALRGNDNKGAVQKPVELITPNVQSLTYTKEGKVLVAVAGEAVVATACGKTYSFDPALPPPTNLTNWDIVIEDWHAPEDAFNVETAITVHTFLSQGLAPWAFFGAGFENVSGVGRYTANFTVPQVPGLSHIGGTLSIGPVMHTSRVFIDGVALPPIDPARPVIDISDRIRAGKSYSLSIEVTTPLFNRIKSTADKTMIWGYQASLMQPLYASLPPQEYGLLGPVFIQWVALEELDGSIEC